MQVFGDIKTKTYSPRINPQPLAFVLILSACALVAFGQEQREIPPAFGPYTNLLPKDFAGAKTFKREFGGRTLYLAPQDSWHVKGDNVCAWGGALGLKHPGIGELGPGYNDSAVYGRKPLLVKREGGKFYAQNWREFLRHPSNFVMIETWSEFHEGTEIGESKEYGRQYIELTRKYAGLFKKGSVESDR